MAARTAGQAADSGSMSSKWPQPSISTSSAWSPAARARSTYRLLISTGTVSSRVPWTAISRPPVGRSAAGFASA